MELVAYLHSEMMSERLQNGESLDQTLDCQLLETITQSSRHAKSVVCVGLVAGTIAINAMPIAAFAYTPKIASIQQLLARRGFTPGAIDGITGPATREAIIAAQTFYKLEADGIIGAKTLAALQEDTYEVGDSTSPQATPISYFLSSDVASVQQLLKDRGFYNGAIDGIKGAITTDAIITAQTFYKLGVDGVAGPQTIGALQSDSFVSNGSPKFVVNDSGSKSSNSVKNLQQLLSDRGFYGGAIDGINGAMTEEAIILAQKTYGLIADGVPSSVTIAALDADPSSYVQPVVTPRNNSVADGSIKQGQTLLSNLGFYNGAIDGIKGSQTTDAIKKAQASFGLPVDGVLSSSTLAALQSSN